MVLDGYVQADAMRALTVHLSQGYGYSEPASSIAGVVFGVLWVVGGALTVRFANFLRSLPAEERKLQPRAFAPAFYIEHPLATKVLGVGMVVLGGAVLVAVLTRGVLYWLGLDPPY